MAIREIVQFGDKTLTRVSRRIEKIDEEVLSLVQDLKDTLYSTDGVGLAAPQIGVLKRAILIDLRNGSEPIILFNPKIIKKMGRTEDIEGCLSYPGYEGPVVRPRRILVTGVTIDGEEVEYTVEGFLARVFCHEIDHLDGIIYTDRCKKVYKVQESEE